MGHEILYCVRCQGQLRSADYDRGAVKSDGRAYCANCAKAEGLKPAPPKPASTRLAAPPQSRGTQRIKIAAPKDNRALMIGVLAGAAALLVIAVIVMLSSRPAPAPVPDPPVVAPRPERPKETPRPPPLVVEKELEPLDGLIRSFTERKDFDGARRALREARARHAVAEWERAIDQRMKDVDFGEEKAKVAAKPVEKPVEKPAIDPALVGHWTFDQVDGGKAPDASGQGNHALMERGAVVVEGRMGSALSVDGRASHASVADSPSLSLMGPFTLTAWVKPSREPVEPGVQRAILEKWEAKDGGARKGFMLRLSQYKAKCVIADDTGLEDVLSAGAIAVDEWTHLAGVYDGKELRIYLNGRLDRTKPATKVPTDGSTALTIGHAPSHGNRFAGAIDDVRVYNRALTSDEIAAFAR